MAETAQPGDMAQQQRHLESLLSAFDIGDEGEPAASGESAADERQQAAAADEAAEAQAEQLSPCGYDVLVRVVRATGLSCSDWLSGSSDPYVVLSTLPAGAEEGQERIRYRTRTVFRDLNPVYDEFFEIGNLPPGSVLEVEVWDKDLLTPDDRLGTASWTFSPKPGRAEGRLRLELALAHRRQRREGGGGKLELEVHYRPSGQAGQARLLGPVRFRQQLSPVSGLLMGHWQDDRTLCYSTFKLFLLHIPEVFEGVSCPWNRSHAAAASIYKNPVMLSAVRTQHAALYATQLGRSRAGVLAGPADLFALLGWGTRGGQRRYFTYSLLPDSMRCSETGAGFWTDHMSKHAMHAGGAEEVLYAGEFCIVPQEGAPGGHSLVLDNNSGTFAPPAEHLHLMAELFASNFPGISVETVAVGDPRLDAYHRQCPSRLRMKASAAAAAAEAVAEVAAEEAAEAAEEKEAQEQEQEQPVQGQGAGGAEQAGAAGQAAGTEQPAASREIDARQLGAGGSAGVSSDG